MRKPTKLAAALASMKKTVLGADLARPATVKMPQAVSEVHLSPTEMIPAGTIITDEIAELAGLDDDTIAGLEDGGHVKYVEVFAIAATPTDA